MSSHRFAVFVLGIVAIVGTCLQSGEPAERPSTTGALASANKADALPGTQLLTAQGDIASDMIDGIDRFLLKQTSNAPSLRTQSWQSFRQAAEGLVWSPDGRLLDTESTRKVTAQDGPLHKEQTARRERLQAMLGLRDQRVSPIQLDIVHSSLTQLNGAVEASETQLIAHAIRWSVFPGVWGEGLLIQPTQSKPKMDVIAIPDADQTPEQFAGITVGVEPHLQLARRLAVNGFRVFVPALINRSVTKRSPAGEPGRAELSSREFVYRPAYELGRHIIGYEVQQVLALVDLIKSGSVEVSTTSNAALAVSPSVGVAGYGEGGMIGLMSAAVDTRIDMGFIDGYFGPREDLWKEPIDRNLFGQLNEFGDAELAALVFPRDLLIQFHHGPMVTLRTQGGAPGRLTSVTTKLKMSESVRLAKLLGAPTVEPSNPDQPIVTGLSVGSLGVQWTNDKTIAWQGAHKLDLDTSIAGAPIRLATPVDNDQRQLRLIQQLIDHSQRILTESHKTRKKYFAKLDTQSLGSYEKTIEPYRDAFRDEVIGRVDMPLSPPRPRTRQTWESSKWNGYEVLLDVLPDVSAYGVLLMPKDLKADEVRPVVVCQHGLEGRPTDVFQGDHYAYHDYAAKLCERGYIVFAPQNIYIYQDRFRTLQRKANPLGLTLFSIMVPQHQQIVNWLKSLPNVDSNRIAFYGLSYGGKSAMRIPALVKDYCLSICSADFNEWVLKNASTTHHFSYVWTNEYEIFEFNLGSTFNYAEMASLICPRPFMVERGHFDGVGEDEWVAYEFAKVKNLYQAKLNIGDRAEIEWFVGPHTINGKGTFEFLDKHLKFTARK